MSNQFFVYLLQSSAGQTYVGATVDLDRRLRQHNKEISGGAHATGVQVARGEVWQRACHVSGFPTWQSALQFEWRWKQLSRADKSTEPMQRRMNALKKLVSLDRATSKAIPYSEWPAPPQIHYECIKETHGYSDVPSEHLTSFSSDQRSA